MSVSVPESIDFAAVFDKSTTPTLIFSPDLTMCWCNAAYAEVTKTDKAELLGQSLYEVFPGRSVDQRKPLDQSFQHVLSTGTSHYIPLLRFDVSTSHSGAQPTFKDHYWSVFNTPIFNQAGEIQFILNQPIDITELTDQCFIDFLKEVYTSGEAHVG